jgi:predicted esterase
MNPMRSWLITLVLPILLTVSASQVAAGPERPKDRDGKARKVILDLLTTLAKADGDVASCAPLYEQLAQEAALSKADALRFAKAALQAALSHGETMPDGATFELTLASGKGTVHTQGAGRGKGLLIGLHGGGPGSGDGASARSAWASAAASIGCAGLFPTVVQGSDMTWNTPDGHRYVLRLLRAATRTWQIDSNRVYVAGHSMGGYGTWSIGSQYADRFAALVAGAGGGWGNATPHNLHNTPIRFFHSTDDPRVPAGSDQALARLLAELREAHPTGYVHQYDEYHDIGHGFPKEGLAPLIKWAGQYKRTPNPRKVIWYADREYPENHHYAWLYSPHPLGHGKIVAEWTSKNRLELSCALPGKLTVLLSPDLIDFDKPLVIAVNGQVVFEEIPNYTLWACALSANTTLDANRLYLGHVVLGGDAPEGNQEPKPER